jgi:hypothetical protein
LRLIGFRGEKISASEAPLEMPFANGNDHPRFTVKESLVIRSMESRSLLRKEHEAGDEEDIDVFGITKYRRNIEMSNQVFSGISSSPKALPRPRLKEFSKLQRDESTLSVDMDVEHYRDSEDEEISLETSDSEDERPIITVKKLEKPPDQNINVTKKDDKKVSDVMAEVRHELHDKFVCNFSSQAFLHASSLSHLPVCLTRGTFSMFERINSHWTVQTSEAMNLGPAVVVSGTSQNQSALSRLLECQKGDQKPERL